MSRCGDYSPHPSWNRTCAINAYGSASHIRIFIRILCAPLSVFSALLSAQRFLFDRAVECATLPSTCFHRFLRYYDDIGLPATRLLILRLFSRLTSYTLSGCNGTSAVPITHLRESLLTSASASPCSQTGGCLTALSFIGQSDIVCCHNKNIDQIPLNNHFQLNHFACATALLLPVLRLELALPLRSQGLGTGGWLDLTRQAFPAVMLSAYKGRSRNQRKTV